MFHDSIYNIGLTQQFQNTNKRCLLFLLVIFVIPSSLIGQSEICDNGIDDDNDSLIDLNDSDCICEVVEAVSLIPNPSFEDMNCCPSDRSQLDCATDWIQASEPTTDFIHTCNWPGWDDFPPPRPFPDGDGIMGFRDGRVRRNSGDAEPFWKEYAGACLLSPLLADSTYRFQFDVGFVDPDKSPPIDITFFGTTDCDNLPFGVGDETFGCPTNSPDWKELAYTRVSGGVSSKWIRTSLEIIPDEDIYAIAIGPNCLPVSSPISIYYFFDNLLLADLQFFNLQIAEVEHPCNENFVLEVPFNAEFEYQWYLFGEALIGETFSKLQNNYGAGEYQVRILDGTSCRVSSSFEYVIPSFESSPAVSICEGDFYQFGDLQLTEPGMYIDTFQTINGCDSMVSLELSVVGDVVDTLAVSIYREDTYEIADSRFSEAGEYSLMLTSDIGCDSLLLLQLSEFDVYIPNVFSPNSDGVNEIFQPFTSDDNIESTELSIYDRWGNLIHQGSEWNGADAVSGVYVYLMKINFSYGGSHLFQGSITIVE